MSLMESLGIDRLSADDRLRLLDEIWESLSATPGDVALSEAHRDDLTRRLDAYRDNPKAGSPWHEVRARLLGRSIEAPRIDFRITKAKGPGVA